MHVMLTCTLASIHVFNRCGSSRGLLFDVTGGPAARSAAVALGTGFGAGSAYRDCEREVSKVSLLACIAGMHGANLDLASTCMRAV